MIYDTIALIAKERTKKVVSQVKPYDIGVILVDLERNGFIQFDWEVIKTSFGDFTNPQMAVLRDYIAQVISNSTGITQVETNMVNEALYLLQIYKQTGVLPSEYEYLLSSSSSFSSSSSSSFSSSCSSSFSSSSCSSCSSYSSACSTSSTSSGSLNYFLLQDSTNFLLQDLTNFLLH